MTPANANAPPRRITLCADDYGISPGVSAAIRDLVTRGRLNATSVMVLPPSFGPGEAEALSALNAGEKRVAIGLHVTMTGPFRPLNPRFRPLTPDGAFLSIGGMMAMAALRRIDAAEAAMEARLQLQAFIAAFGRPPDFLDGHQHAHLLPGLREGVLDAMREGAPGAFVRQCGSALPWTRRLRDRKGLVIDTLSRAFRAQAERRQVPFNAAFAGTYDFASTAAFADLFPSFLDALPDGGLAMCHPGHVDDELARLDPLTTRREEEYAYFRGDGFVAALASRNMNLRRA